VEEIVLRAMARRPDDRYASADDLRAALLNVDLRRLPAEDATSAIEVLDPTPVPGEVASFARRERSWLVPAALILVVAVTLGIVGVLVGRSEVGQKLLDNGKDDEAAQPVTIGAPASFDPEGDGSENNGELPNLTDDDAGTAWRTDHYNSRQLGGLKSGVGVVLPASAPTTFRSLIVHSPSPGWSASVYVADEAATTLAGWGRPVATIRTGGDATVDLGGQRGGAVLLWITDLGPDQRVSISEVQLQH
jgi:hypothetical protein